MLPMAVFFIYISNISKVSRFLRDTLEILDKKKGAKYCLIKIKLLSLQKNT